MSPLSILIVDDDTDFADGMAEVLELDGHAVDIARTRKGGVEAAGGKGYDAAIIDIGLPDGNGVECLVEIKRIQPETRCILMTGYSADHIAKQGIEEGALEILIKPVDAGKLSRLLAAIGDGDGDAER